jgi:uncharacterized protein (TIRG00374 family)
MTRIKGLLMKWLALAVSVAMLWAIYARIDRGLLLQRLTSLHIGYFGLALFLFVPQILVTSLRWRFMISCVRPMSLWDSVRLVMAGKAMNAIAPSKLGEVSKAYFLKREEGVDIGQAVSVVVLEKALDMGGLCIALLFGVIFAPDNTPAVWLGALIAIGFLLGMGLLLTLPIGVMGARLTNWNPKLGKIAKLLDGWSTVLSMWKRRGGGLPAILGLSVLLWGLHVMQIYLFFPSLGKWMPLAPVLAYVPLSLLVGLLPITIGGMGTRDSALIFLFSSYADPSIMAGVGLLCSLRYWVDTLLGVPFFHQYMSNTQYAAESSQR